MIEPAGFELEVEHDPTVAAADLAELYLDLAARVGFPAVRGWTAGNLAAEGSDAGGLHSFLADADGPQRQFTVGLTGTGTFDATPSSDAWKVSGSPPAEADDTDLREWLLRSQRLVLALAATPGFGTAVLRRYASTGGAFVPAPPLARWNHMIVTDEAEVAAAYAEPAVFWRAWDDHEVIGDHHAVWRALDAVDERDWARAVLDAQMDMARRARPGATEWFEAQLEPWNEEFLAEPDSRLNVVGYDEGTRTLELAGYFDRRDHVPLRDVLSVAELTRSGEMTDGRPLAAVRVVFVDREQAEAEAVPLLDAGAEIHYTDLDGGLVQLG